jgi:hypothetical protein
MDDEMLRLECLKLAKGDADAAERAFNWVKRRGEFSGASVYDRALEMAQSKAKARVVGRDGDVPEFRDYLKD